MRLRREPGSTTWRVQIVDVRSGAATAVSVATDEGDTNLVPFAAALGAAIERLFGRSTHIRSVA